MLKVYQVLKNFDNKKMNLEDVLVSNHQKLLKLQDPNLDGDDDAHLEEMDKMKMQNKWIGIVIQSYKGALNTLRSLR